MWILIPSYEPDQRLVDVVSELRAVHPVVVVDDGSGPAFAQHFEACAAKGAVVLRHPANAGKGAALRTGFAWLTEHAPGEDVVCADSDGQHRPADIGRVGAELARRRALGEDDAVVLGVREFVGEVPLRSRVGNRATTALLAAVTGLRVSDTQTGLRGYPASLLPWAIEVRGQRFAYELQLLIDAGRRGVPMVEVPIATVYLDHNASSHFRPVVDSARVLAPLGAFAAASLLSFVIDGVALVVLAEVTGTLAIAVAGARLLSATVNFTLNRQVVFRADGPLRSQVVRYGALAVALGMASYASLAVLTGLGMPLIPAKILTDITLWGTSFTAQRILVFKRHRTHVTHVMAHDSQVSSTSSHV